MKKILLLLTLLLADGMTITAQDVVRIYKSNGEVMEIDADEVDSIYYTGVEAKSYVDMGFHSGTLWAKCNLGATSPEEFGDYFAWGEVTPQENHEYTDASYKWFCGVPNYSLDFSKYNQKEDDTLLPEDDAAVYNLGGEWSMPLKGDLWELDTYSYVTQDTLNGVPGLRYTSKFNGNSIFLPSAGYYLDGKLNEGGGRYYSTGCSSYNYPPKVYILGWTSGRKSFYGSIVERWCGCSIRPVIRKNKYY